MSVIKKLNIKLFAVLIGFLTSNIALAEVAVIVNAANNTAIADGDFSRIFLGKVKKFSNGEKVAIVNLKYKQATRNEFEEKVLKKSASQVKAYWSKLMFSGKGKPPKELGSDKDVIAFVASNPGAIGYIDSASADGSIKVVKTF